MDVEDAHTIAANFTTVAATSAAAVATDTIAKLPAKDPGGVVQVAAMASGPHLPEAISEATATEAEMVSVPLAEQHATALSDAGINAAYLNDSTASPAAAEALSSSKDALLVESRTLSVVAVATASSGAAVVPAAASSSGADLSGLSALTISTALTHSAVVTALGTGEQQQGDDAAAVQSEAAMRRSLQGEALGTAAGTEAPAVKSDAVGVAADEPGAQQYGSVSVYQSGAAEEAGEMQVEGRNQGQGGIQVAGASNQLTIRSCPC